jgi:hypothetical protein
LKEKMDDLLPMAFAVHRHDPPGLEVRINFGLLTSRAASPAEVDRLAEWLLDEVGHVSIICEERHEIDAHAEASVHLVRVELPTEDIPHEAAALADLEQRLVERCDHWARICASERHLDVAEL